MYKMVSYYLQVILPVEGGSVNKKSCHWVRIGDQECAFCKHTEPKCLRPSAALPDCPLYRPVYCVKIISFFRTIIGAAQVVDIEYFSQTVFNGDFPSPDRFLLN